SIILYLYLPMEVGKWWYVYPREATAAAFLAIALVPDLPRAARWRVPLALVAAAAPLPLARVVTDNYRAFDASTSDFAEITQMLPRAPKLLYLVFDHSGSTRTVSPFTHLPAWVQAERGGWLSFHMSAYGTSPFSYRPRKGRVDVIPPPVPPGWE